jgi:hypothetical protein
VYLGEDQEALTDALFQIWTALVWGRGEDVAWRSG